MNQKELKERLIKMSEWIDFSEIKPDKLGEYKVKIKSSLEGSAFLFDVKATWVPKEKLFYSEHFEASRNNLIVAWERIE